MERPTPEFRAIKDGGVDAIGISLIAHLRREIGRQQMRPAQRLLTEALP